jgi:uncharacterized protein DUF3105
MASRKEEKERRRQERLAAEREAAEQAKRRRTYGIFAGGVLVVATLVVITVVVAAGGGGGDGGSKGGNEAGLPAAIEPPPEKIRDLNEAAKAAKCKLANPPIAGREHTTKPVKYATNPPTSGNHNPIPTPDGAYGKAPGITHLVHSLEHGRVEYEFLPSTPKRRIAQLRGLFDADPYHTILTPNPTKMPYQAAVVAWGHLAGCKRVNDQTFDVFRAFKARYVDKGPEFVP